MEGQKQLCDMETLRTNVARGWNGGRVRYGNSAEVACFHEREGVARAMGSLPRWLGFFFGMESRAFANVRAGGICLAICFC